MMKKLSDLYLFSDIDGTLGIAGIGIPEENKRAIRRFVEAGGHFGLCTGRWVPNITDFVAGIPLNAPSIVAGGCSIYDFAAGKSLHSIHLPDTARECVDKIMDRHPGLGLVVVNEVGYYLVGDEGRLIRMYGRRPLPHPLRTLDEIPGPYYKFLFLVPDAAAEELVREFLAMGYAGMTFVRSAEGSIEMLPQGVSKAAAFLRMIEEQKIPIENTVFIGDYYNDKEMFTTAGLTACVASTPEDLRALCDLQMGECLNGAVAELIEHLEKAQQESWKASTIPAL